MRTPVEVPHFSHSQLNTYETCGLRYEFRHVKGLKMPPGIALLVGGGVHGGAEHALTEKMASGENLSPDDVRDAAVNSFDEKVSKDGVGLTDEEKTVGEANVIGTARDRVAAMGHYWACVGLPGYQPIGVEKEVWLPTEKIIGKPMLGYIDVVEENRVSDLKTSQRRKNQSEAHSSTQLTVYAWARFLETGTMPEVALDVLTDTASETNREVLTSTRNREDCERLLDRIKRTCQAIDAGIFIPTTPNNWLCSPKFCGFWPVCPARPRQK